MTWNRIVSSRGALAVFACSALWMCIGCPAKQVEKAKTETTEAAPAQIMEGDTDSILDTIVSMLDQSRDNEASFVGVFEHANQYMEIHKDQVKPLDQATIDKIEKYFGSGSSTAVVRKDFKQDDMRFIRDAMFLQEVVNAIPREGLSDQVFAEKLLDWVARYVHLTKTGVLEQAKPREVCIRGAGNVFERSWLFVELLRQAGLQACMIGVPSKNTLDPIASMLCGLIIGEEVYVYDPTYGIPVPSAKSGIATLKELQANPKLIEFFNADPKTPTYWAKAEDIKNFSLLMVLEPRMFAPRMKLLESKLVGKMRTNLAVDMDIWLSRAQTALSGVPGSNGVRIWKFPLNVEERLRTEPTAIQELFRSGNAMWWTIELPVRLMQLRGQHQPAVKRLAELQTELTPNAIDEKLRAIRIPDFDRQKSVSNTRFDIFYFIGLGKLDDPVNPGYKVAADWFRRYYDNESSVELTPADILSWSSLVQKLAFEGAAPNPTPAKRIWELFDEPTRKACKEISDHRPALTVWQRELIFLNQLGMKMTQDAAEAGSLNVAQFLETVETEGQRMAADPSDAAMQNFGGTLVKMVENVRQVGKEHNAQPKENDFRAQLQQQMNQRQNMFGDYTQRDNIHKEHIMKVLSDLLRRPDLFRPSDFESVPEGAAIFARPKFDNSPLETLRRNHDLLAAGFSKEIASRRQLWIAAAIRNRATALKRMGKLDEAVAILKTPVPDLQPQDRAVLATLAKYWQKK